jgi:membrane protease YdiL (CAAX protease family)
MASKYYRVTDWRTRLESVGHSVGVVVAAFLLGYLFTYVVAFVLVGLGFVSLEVFTNPDVPLPGWVAIVAFIAQFSGFVAAVVAYLAWRDETDLFEYGVPDLTDLAWGVAGLVGLFVAAFAVSALIQLLGAETATNEVVELGQQNPRLFLYLIPVTILVVAPAEELLFRGVVQGLFRRAYGVVPGLVLASALFGVAHWLALTGGGKLTYVAIAAVLGIVLGTVYELTDNLVVPVAIHGAWNAFLFGVQYLVATGAVQP